MKQVILNQIQNAVSSEEKLLGVLIDPEKFDLNSISIFLRRVPQETTFILVGGSTGTRKETEILVQAVKQHSSLPVILFPGDFSQITLTADALLFLTLISGNNPEYLIDQQVKAVPRLKNSALEVIPTGYILIDGGKKSAVEKVSGTKPLPQHDVGVVIDIALAGEYSGKKLIYLETGSGSEYPVSEEIITEVKKAITVPLIVGGGINTKRQMENIYAAGADIVVVGTAFEKGSFQ